MKHSGIVHRYDYAACLRRIYNINKSFKQVKQGLENIKRLENALGSPSKAGYKIVHVAGTNGKGSVCWKVSQALKALGYRTGLFVSPHISSFRERCMVNHVEITQQSVEKYLNHIFDVCEREAIPATFFEMVVAMSLLHFAESKVDIAVLEAGLGGRLDATNVISESWMSVITNVGLDHTKVLGTNTNAICWEKAGIIKPKGHVCIGENVPISVVEPICRHQDATLYLPPKTDVSGTRKRSFDQENTELSRRILEILVGKNSFSSSMEEALQTRPPCRFQQMEFGNGLPIILDVAHNPPAFVSLFEAVQYIYPNKNLRVVMALSGLKDALECTKVLYSQRHLSALYVTKANHDKAMEVNTLEKYARTVSMNTPNNTSLSIFPSIQQAIESARAASDNRNDVIVVCGSVYMMAEVRATLAIPQIIDEPENKMK